MNINDLRVDDWMSRTGEQRMMTESELLGLAVQLLKQRGAEVRTTHKGNIGVKDWEPGRYLVVPLSALEGTESPLPPAAPWGFDDVGER